MMDGCPWSDRTLRKIQLQGNMSASDIWTSLQNSHPFMLNKLKDRRPGGEFDLERADPGSAAKGDADQRERWNARAATIRISNGDAISLNFW